MRLRRPILLGTVAMAACLLGGIAFAAAYEGQFAATWNLPVYAKRGAFIGTGSASDTAHRITKVLGGTKDFDFADGTIVCEDSTAATVTGAAVNDRCVLGIDDDAYGAGNSSFSCYVSASNAVKVRHCPAGTASNPPDAGFYITVISHQ